MCLTVMNRFFLPVIIFEEECQKGGNVYPSGHAGDGKQKYNSYNFFVIISSLPEADIALR